MGLKADLIAYLRSKASLTSLVDSSKIRREHRVQAADLPAVTINLMEWGHAEEITGSGGYAETRVSIHVWAKTDDSRDAIGEAIRNVLHGFSGLMGSTTIQVINFAPDSGGGDAEFFEPPRHANEDGTFHRVMDFTVSHIESIPTFA